MKALHACEGSGLVLQDDVEDLQAGANREGEQALLSSPASSAMATVTVSGSDTADSCVSRTASDLAFLGVVRPVRAWRIVVW